MACPSGAFAAILDDEGRVLLCHRTDFDLWNLPGGGVEEGESPWEAVVREVREEVGLEVTVERLTGLYWKPGRELVFQFVCEVVGGELGTSEEADDARYFDVDGLPDNLSPRQAERIRDVAAGSSETLLKVQTAPGARELIERGEIKRSP